MPHFSSAREPLNQSRELS